MQRLSIFFFLLGMTACERNSYTETLSKDIINKEEVHHTIARWATAMLDNKLEPQKKILDDTWIYSGSEDGKTTNKEKALAGFKPGETALKGIILQDTVVRVYGNFAIITGREELLFVEKSDTNRVQMRFTDVFIKHNGRVTAISTHSSPIKQHDNTKSSASIEKGENCATTSLVSNNHHN